MVWYGSGTIWYNAMPPARHRDPHNTRRPPSRPPASSPSTQAHAIVSRLCRSSQYVAYHGDGGCRGVVESEAEVVSLRRQQCQPSAYTTITSLATMAMDEPLIHYVNRQLIGLVSTQQYLSFVAEKQVTTNYHRQDQSHRLLLCRHCNLLPRRIASVLIIINNQQ